MKKTLSIVGCLTIGIIILVIAIFIVTTAKTKKMVCKSNEGNITIRYDDKKLVGYSTKGFSYNYKEQKKYADQIGVDAYLTEFSTWFSNNTTGTCTK